MEVLTLRGGANYLGEGFARGTAGRRKLCINLLIASIGKHWHWHYFLIVLLVWFLNKSYFYLNGKKYVAPLTIKSFKSDRIVKWSFQKSYHIKRKKKSFCFLNCSLNSMQLTNQLVQNVCWQVRRHLHTHTNTHTHICTCTHTCTCTRSFTHICTHTHFIIYILI